MKRYYEPFFCDALRLAAHLAEKYNSTITEGIGNSSDFNARAKIDSDEVRFLRVEGVCEIGFSTTDEPTSEDTKYRNKSFWRVVFGERLKEAREKKGISIEELSEMTGFRDRSLERIEEGRWDADIAQIGNILDALGCTFNIDM